MRLFPTHRRQRQLSTESPGLARHGEASPLKLAQPRAGPPAAAPVDPGGQVTPCRRLAAVILPAVRVPGQGLAGGLPRSKPPSSLAAKRGSDDGGGPANRGGYGKTFRVTGT